MFAGHSRGSLSGLRAKLISQALKDPLFHEALSEAACEIVERAKVAPNEATIESAFEQILYATLKAIDVQFRPTKEATVIRQHTQKGRIDSRLGALVIEFKQPSTLGSPANITKAQSQLLGYLRAITETDNTLAVGWITDGIKACEIRCFDGTTENLGFFPVTGKLLLRLTQQIVSLEQRALTSQNLIEDFCGDSHQGVVFQLARHLSETFGANSTLKSQMLNAEWRELFRLAHEDQSLQKRIRDRRTSLSRIFKTAVDSAKLEYQLLFCLHTSYVIILKLIAYRVVCDIKFNTVLQNFKSLAVSDSDALRAFCASLEDGEIFRQIGILNLLEGDFFSWYADQKQWNDDIAGGVQSVVQMLAKYEDVRSVFSERSAVDLFRALYEATVPQTVRAGFGEFYTPYWLAQHVVSKAGLRANDSVLDPCCGSGTFIIAAISAIRQENRKTPITAKEIFGRVVGIDLNPLAVLTARVHYFICIADLLEAEDVGQFVIPVFLGDASNIPAVTKEDGVEFFHYELKTLKTPLTIRIPKKMCTDIIAFTQIMAEFESLVRDKKFSQAKNALLSSAVAIEDRQIISKRINELSDQLIDLEKHEWNGIWARIVTNFIATASVGPFDCIVGNPPWIDWKSLPATYREEVKAICSPNLFSGSGRTGGINLNICALITHVAARNWLAKGGHLAFLMPKVLINQASYEGWRNAVGGDDFSLIALHDWTSAGHPFDPVKEDFLTFVFENRRRSQKKLPVFFCVQKKRGSKTATWHTVCEALDNLHIIKQCAGQIVSGKSSYTIGANSAELESFKKIAGECAYKGREGMEFYPQELRIFRYKKAGRQKGTAFFENFQSAKSKYKIPVQQVLLETKYLYPLVKGPNVIRLGYRDPDLYVAFPYDFSNPHAPINEVRLHKESPLLLQFYKKFRKQLEQQTPYSDMIRGEGAFYGVARTGPYSFRDCYVAFRDNTKWHATVIQKKTCHWGEKKRFIFQNHAASMCERPDGRYIDINEAFFVAGILNTPIVEKFIYASSDNRSFKVRPPIFVPLFDPNDRRHKTISKLTRKAFEQSGQPDKNGQTLKQIEKIYLDIASTRP